MMWRVFCLELRVAFRHGADIAGPLWFFLMVITLFPLSVGPQPQLLARIAPGIIQVAALLASLLALGFLAAPGVALTAGLRRGGVLLGILVLPLSVPVLIFAAAAMDAASMHLPADGYLAVLGALLAGSATLSPFATAAALRLSVQ
ncbi:heme ABC transporter permease [Salmonella enterica]|nr:heme ABC transporter permease [Salmonella enterica]EKF5638557.1 heme exporter protein CcmB [Salmonella enterica subsp. enterica serovar Agona]EEL0096529.1 heme ABC transporter permease [Salmonella enterica]EFT7557218.1 heme ABC transporter permease [Salmonella enterica]EFU3732302.1 heme ABC transporter permease [Salmonella enterica]